MIQQLGRWFTWNVKFFLRKIQCLIFSENYPPKNVVYCSLTFKVTHRALDNMYKHRALDNMNLICMNRRRQKLINILDWINSPTLYTGRIQFLFAVCPSFLFVNFLSIFHSFFVNLTKALRHLNNKSQKRIALKTPVNPASYRFTGINIIFFIFSPLKHSLWALVINRHHEYPQSMFAIDLG